MSHYDTLGVDRSATPEELKRAWRALQLQWHPDRCKEEGAARRFAEINAAYAAVGNIEARRSYDEGRTRAEPRLELAGGHVLHELRQQRRIVVAGGEEHRPSP